MNPDKVKKKSSSTPRKKSGKAADANLIAAEQALKESEAQLKEAQHLTRIGSWNYVLSTRKLSWSEELYTIFGRDPHLSPLSADERDQYYAPESLARLRKVFRKALISGHPYELELEMVRPDGTRWWGLARGNSVRNKTGRVVRIYGTFQDITEIKLAEEELRKERNKAQKYLDVVGVILVVVNVTGEITLINKRGCEILGYEEKELIGKNWFKMCLPARSRKNVQSIIPGLIAGEMRPGEYNENPVVTKTGEERIIAWHNTLLRDEKGGVTGVLSSGEDITDHKRAEEALRESENKYRELVESANSIILRMDSQGTITFFNEFAQNFFGFKLSEIIGRNIVGTIVPESDSSGRSMAELTSYIALDSVKYTNTEYENTKKNGGRVWVSWTTKLIRDDSGIIKEILCIGNDISERKRAEAELERNLRETRVRFTISQALAGKETEDDVLDALIKLVSVYTQWYMSIVIFDRSGDEPAITKFRFEPFESGIGTYIDIGTSFLILRHPYTNYFSAERPFISDNIRVDNRLDAMSREIYRQSEVASIAVFPLTLENDWMGSMILGSKIEAYFDAEKLYFCDSMAEQGTRALRAARLRQKIRESQQRQLLLIQQSPLGVIEWNMDYQVVSWNPAAERIFGYTLDEAFGRHPVGLIMPEDAGQDAPPDLENLFAHTRGMPIVHDVLTKSGRVITCEWFNTKIVGSDGNATGIVTLVQDITERKLAETTLRESEKKYHELADFLPEIIFETDTYGTLTYVNRIAYAMIGFTDEDIAKGLDIADWIAPGHRDRFRADFSAILNGAWGFGSEYAMRRSDNTEFPVIINSRAIKLNETIRGMRGIIVDITERKNSETALKKSEEKFSRAFQHILIPMTITRLSDRVFIDVNEEFLNIYEYSREEVVGKSAHELGLWIKPEERKIFIQAMIKSGKAGNARVHFRTKTGKILKALFSGTLLTVGEEPCFLGWALDLTEVENITEALQLSEERFRSLFEDSGDAQFLLDGKMIIDCNTEAIKLMGCGNKSQLLQSFIYDFSPNIQPDGESSISKAGKYSMLALDKRSIKFEWQCRRMDGSLFIAEIVMTTIPMMGKDILHANVRDISERKRLQNEIINIIDVEQQRLGQNLHDGLGQELTGIAFLCGTLTKRLKELLPTEAGRSEEITGHIYRIITMVRSLSHELYPPNLVENEITFTLSDFASKTGSLFGITCTFEQDPELVIRDMFVSSQIYYTVREAVHNSIRHGKAERIIIKLTLAADKLNLTVEDDGIGLPEAYTMKKGLGLRIMAYRMNSINGTFEVRRNASGGTTVFCMFPAQTAFSSENEQCEITN